MTTKDLPETVWILWQRNGTHPESLWAMADVFDTERYARRAAERVLLARPWQALAITCHDSGVPLVWSSPEHAPVTAKEEVRSLPRVTWKDVSHACVPVLKERCARE